MSTGLIADLQVPALLRALDAGPADTVVIHASFSALSRKGHRAEALLDGLSAHLRMGTLAMPAMSWRSVNPDHPLFDELKTPAITGVLSETFRTGYATHRSLHPTHSLAARGPLAAKITGTHHLDPTPCGRSSPWSILADVDALVVMLGVEMDCCTLVHCLEERTEPEGYLRDEVEEYVCRDRHGADHKVRTRRHRKIVRNFWKFETMMRESGRMRYANLEGSPVFAFRARDLMQIGMDHMRSNPLGTRAAHNERGKLM
jgi:aminoglycoside 3-N-acetyltransferase